MAEFSGVSTITVPPVFEGGYLDIRVKLSGVGADTPSGQALIGIYTSLLTGPVALQKQQVYIQDYGILIRYEVPNNKETDSRGTVSVHGKLNLDSNRTLQIDFEGEVIDNDNYSFTVDLTAQNIGDSSLSINKLLSNIGFRQAGTPSSTSWDSGRDLIGGDVLRATSSTTAVAALSYQFFTGKLPTMEGMRHLIGADGSNPNGLSTAYYARFNSENRYINFASNLGIFGEGAGAFKENYGPLSMHDAIIKAYTEIVGPPEAISTFSAAVTSIEKSVPYFQAVARERIGGSDLDLSAKAAMVGYLLQEVVKADITNHVYDYLPDLPPVGSYARALENYYLDLSDGSALGGVSLLGAYGKGTFLDGYDG